MKKFISFAWFIVVCIVMLGVMAYPKFCEAWNDLND